MDPKLDATLVKKYPLLYADRHKDMKVTAMCWGFQHGDGWYKIIDKLSAKLEALIKKEPKDERKGIKATTVKEKFGTLRFYMDGSTQEMGDLIRVAEMESARTCESCSKPAKVKWNGGWANCLCAKCYKEYKAKLDDEPNGLPVPKNPPKGGKHAKKS